MTPHLRPGLLDTNAVILLPSLDPESIPVAPKISALTLAELHVGPLIARDEETRRRRQSELELAQRAFDAMPFELAAAEAFGAVSFSLRRAGKPAAARSIDAMIAAVAIANGLPLYTCDPADFAGIDGLEVVPIPHPDTP